MLALASRLQLEAKLFRGLSDASRLALLTALQTGPKTVGELVAATGLSQSNTSNHLGCLRDCALVRARQEGRHVRYEISDARIGKLLTLSRSLLADVAAEIESCLNYEPRRRRHG